MRFCRTTVFVLLLAAFAFAAAPARAQSPVLWPPQDPLAQIFLVAGGGPGAHPACGAYCDTAGGGTTPTATAIGSSCTTAQSNLTAQLKSYAMGVCGNRACDLVVTTTIACYANGGGFSVGGYATFGCPDSTC